MKPFDYSRIHKPLLVRVAGKLAHGAMHKLYKPLLYSGEENMPLNGAFIVASNHINALDPLPIMLAAYPRREIHYMAKAELFKNFAASRLLKVGGAFPVKRGIGSRGALNYACMLLRAGRAVGIFPEGTRFPGGAPQEPRTGVAKLAYETGAPVLPCAIYSPGRGAFGEPVTLRFGKLMHNSEIDFGDGKSGGRKTASAQIMKEISRLWEELRDEQRNTQAKN